VNLVRNQDGRWNLESLIERVEKNPVAPTDKAKTERRPGFPYIEADRGRINLKVGQEKKPYALTDADFSVWQDSENGWGMRLKAQPLRTDFNLSDTGLVRVNGSWQRAASLRETPLDFAMQWDGAQLGQASKLASGSDRGWRGTLTVTGKFYGTPSSLTISTAASVEDFRRYDIPGGTALTLTARCDALYSSADHSLSSVSCDAPVKGGLVNVAGWAAPFSSSPEYDITVNAHDVPAQSLVALARRAKKNLPDDLTADGKLNASVTLRRSPAQTEWSGGGVIEDLRLSSATTSTDITVGEVPLEISTGENRTSERQRRRDPQAQVEPVRLEIGAVNLPMGKPNPVVGRGWISREGYSFSLAGDTQLQKFLQAARTLGLPAAHPAAEGTAKVDLQIAGQWTGFAGTHAVGKAQLRAVRAEIRGVNSPIEITTADIQLEPERVRIENLSSSVAGTAWHGSMSLPRGCKDAQSCPVRFALRADQLSTDTLNQLLDPNPRQRPWYRFLGKTPAMPSYLGVVNARGTLAVGRLTIRRLIANHVAAEVELKDRQLKITDLRGEVLGGKHSGEWSADFSVRPPVYHGSGTFDHVALAQLAKIMQDDWVSGIGDGTYRISFSGMTSADMTDSAEGTLSIDAHDTTLAHISFPDSNDPLLAHRLQAQFALKDKALQIVDGKLEVAGNTYQLSGTASQGQTLDMKLQRSGSHGFLIHGTLKEPHMVPAASSETQASLKP
jgi:hypothetical protein